MIVEYRGQKFTHRTASLKRRLRLNPRVCVTTDGGVRHCKLREAWGLLPEPKPVPEKAKPKPVKVAKAKKIKTGK